MQQLCVTNQSTDEKEDHIPRREEDQNLEAQKDTSPQEVEFVFKQEHNQLSLFSLQKKYN